MFKKISVIGNSGAGKTTLSINLGKALNLPVTHIDSIQFTNNMQIRNLDETRTELNKITSQEQWIIDGYGPLDILEQRLLKSDVIVFIDFPIWRHYFWNLKRQIVNYAKDPSLLTIKHSLTVFKKMWKIHKKMRPEIIKLLSSKYLHNKVQYIRSIKDLDNFVYSLQKK